MQIGTNLFKIFGVVQILILMVLNKQGLFNESPASCVLVHFGPTGLQFDLFGSFLEVIVTWSIHVQLPQVKQLGSLESGTQIDWRYKEGDC